MPKLPIIKDRQLRRALKNLGFYEHRQKSTSHLIMVSADGRRTTVPVHPERDIPNGTMRTILKDINISIEEFIKAMRN